MIVQLNIIGSEVPARLTPNRKYTVLGIEADSYRILNDSDEPCLYDPPKFVILDETEPDFWITELGEDGERYAYPPEWHGAGFFEDWHDNVVSVREIFRSVLKSRYQLIDKNEFNTP